MQDDWHPGVDGRHQFIRFGGYDREGLEPVPLGVLPGVPKAREAHEIAKDSHVSTPTTEQSIRRT